MTKKKVKSRLGIDSVEVLGHTFKVIETDKDEDLLMDRNVTMGFIRYFDSVCSIFCNDCLESI